MTTTENTTLTDSDIRADIHDELARVLNLDADTQVNVTAPRDGTSGDDRTVAIVEIARYRGPCCDTASRTSPPWAVRDQWGQTIGAHQSQCSVCGSQGASWDLTEVVVTKDTWLDSTWLEDLR